MQCIFSRFLFQHISTGLKKNLVAFHWNSSSLQPFINEQHSCIKQLFLSNQMECLKPRTSTEFGQNSRVALLLFREKISLTHPFDVSSVFEKCDGLSAEGLTQKILPR